MLPKLPPRPNLVPAIDSSPPLSTWYLHLSMITVGWSRPAIRRFRTLPFAASDFSQSLTRFSQWTGPAWNIQESGRYLKGSDFPTNLTRRLLPMSVSLDYCLVCNHFIICSDNNQAPMNSEVVSKALLCIWHSKWAHNIWHSKGAHNNISHSKRANNSSADYREELILACIKSCTATKSLPWSICNIRFASVH